MNVKEYCNSLYDELDGVKSRLNYYIGQIQSFRGEDKKHVGSHVEHLEEIIKTIDWKLEIIAKACPLDRFSEGAEDTASVPIDEDPGERGKRAAGGSMGG